MTDPAQPPRLSVCLITLDEAHHIERCLRSVSFADEWVVLDSGSRDETVALARALGARVSTATDWPGFGPQKNRALDLANGEWVFSIDADEWVSQELAESIRAVVQAAPVGDRGQVYSGVAAVAAAASAPRSYWVERRSTFCGKLIRFGDWGGDRVLRLFPRAGSRFSDDVVHERVLAPHPHSTLPGYLWHDSVESLADARAKMIRYARLGAGKLRAQGRQVGELAARAKGLWTFLRGFVLRGGFLDGREGWLIARFNARGTYLRYRWSGLDVAQTDIEAQREAAIAR